MSSQSSPDPIQLLFLLILQVAEEDDRIGAGTFIRLKDIYNELYEGTE